MTDRIHRVGSSHDPGISLEDLVKDEELKLSQLLKSRVPNARSDQIVRFLRARKGNVDKAEEMLKAHLEWRRTKLPEKLTENVKQELEKNKYCFFGTDKHGHKVIIARLRLMGKHTYDSLDIVEASLIYLAEFMESNLAPLEQITVIFSRVEAKRANSDLDWVKCAAGLFQNNYPERLRRAMVGPINIFFRGLWQVAQYIFDPETREKIVLTKDVETFLEWVEPEHLPSELGGGNAEELNAEAIVSYASTYEKPEAKFVTSEGN